MAELEQHQRRPALKPPGAPAEIQAEPPWKARVICAGLAEGPSQPPVLAEALPRGHVPTLGTQDLGLCPQQQHRLAHLVSRESHSGALMEETSHLLCVSSGSWEKIVAQMLSLYPHFGLCE